MPIWLAAGRTSGQLGSESSTEFNLKFGKKDHYDWLRVLARSPAAEGGISLQVGGGSSPGRLASSGGSGTSAPRPGSGSSFHWQVPQSCQPESLTQASDCGTVTGTVTVQRTGSQLSESTAAAPTPGRHGLNQCSGIQRPDGLPSPSRPDPVRAYATVDQKTTGIPRLCASTAFANAAEFSGFRTRDRCRRSRVSLAAWRRPTGAGP